MAGPGRRGRGRRGGASVFREPRAGRGPQRLVVELEPLTANQLAVQADLLLWFALGTVAIVLLLSALFARVLNQRARLATELERDRQLAALGEMSAVLAHELRNPLASLKGHAQLLVESLTPGAAPERKAQRVVDEAVRIEHLISDLLEFARTGELNRQAIDAWDIVLAAAEDVGKDLVRLESPGTTKPENGRPRRWRLDGARVEQSLGNVLRNAVQASPPGDKPVVSLGLDGDDLVITVRDFGDGITPGDEERIFAPFHTGRVRGTGLGLAIARRIVERHGGQIVAGNHPDGGAEIRLIFPGDARVLETAPETAPGTEPAGSSSGPARGVDSRGADE